MSYSAPSLLDELRSTLAPVCDKKTERVGCFLVIVVTPADRPHHSHPKVDLPGLAQRACRRRAGLPKRCTSATTLRHCFWPRTCSKVARILRNHPDGCWGIGDLERDQPLYPAISHLATPPGNATGQSSGLAETERRITNRDQLD